MQDIVYLLIMITVGAVGIIGFYAGWYPKRNGWMFAMAFPLAVTARAMMNGTADARLLWFSAALLVFCVGVVVFRRLRPTQ